MAMGERAPLALIDAPASARMAVGEAITNIAAAPVATSRDVKLSANWMAAAGHPGEDAALYDTVRAVALELCPALGIGIPVGKDSLSMKTTWERRRRGERQVTAPLSLIVSAFAPVRRCAPRADAAAARWTRRRRELLLIDLGARQEPARRLGARAGLRAARQCARRTSTTRAAGAFFEAVQALTRDGLLLAYHDRSDGGLFAALCEMAFACALRPGRSTSMACCGDAARRTLFAEELGAPCRHAARRVDAMRAVSLTAGLRAVRTRSGAPASAATGDRDSRARRSTVLSSARRIDLQRAWSETTWRMQALRDNPDARARNTTRILDAAIRACTRC